MKIGTDGVLLGAWASLQNGPNAVLDIGAGTGVIALILAQRSNAETIDAIEVDENAYEQCVENFEASPWADRLFCYHAGLEEFVEEIEETYDLIVSNPPFYSEKVSSGDLSRDMARQNQSLPFHELIKGICKLLSRTGIFATIIPFKEEERFMELAVKCGLFPQRITRVKGNLNAEIKRSLIALGFKKTDVEKTELTIEIKRHQYTKEYVNLTRDFYLKM